MPIPEIHSPEFFNDVNVLYKIYWATSKKYRQPFLRSLTPKHRTALQIKLDLEAGMCLDQIASNVGCDLPTLVEYMTALNMEKVSKRTL